MKIALHWFRRDLRLTDNAALHAATTENELVHSVFVFDPKILQAPDTGARRVAFLLESLRSLEKNCAVAGGRLIVRHGDVLEEMKQLLQETRAQTLYFNRDYEPYARQRDDKIEQVARQLGLTVKTYKDGVIHEPHEVLKADGAPYTVFTPFSKVWRAQKFPAVLPPAKFPAPPTPATELVSMGIPELADLGLKLDIVLIPSGERAALDLLKKFATGPALHYQTQRNFPALDGTSQLSPHLRFGTISPRTILATIHRTAQEHPSAQKELDVFVSEMIWRDFYRAILWHFPHVAESAFKPNCNEIKWEKNERHFQAWCEGRTGFPIVDAAMRQLNTTGWMHNRLRMIAAMFLTKDLLINYQWGERYFMQKLYDGDLSANNGGWQWSASTGTDASPYFRIFNPTSQAEKFDPEGRFIHRFIEEIDRLDYPAPIVDHGEQRIKVLKLFQELKP